MRKTFDSKAEEQAYYIDRKWSDVYQDNPMLERLMGRLEYENKTVFFEAIADIVEEFILEDLEKEAIDRAC